MIPRTTHRYPNTSVWLSLYLRRPCSMNNAQVPVIAYSEPEAYSEWYWWSELRGKNGTIFGGNNATVHSDTLTSSRSVMMEGTLTPGLSSTLMFLEFAITYTSEIKDNEINKQIPYFWQIKIVDSVALLFQNVFLQN